jgi:argininosuccinate lyase
MNPLVEEFTRSIHYDKRLVECDLLGSMLHVEVLRRAKYLTPAEASKLYKGLSALHKKATAGTYKADPVSEDIHTDIQNKLANIVGNLALKLHTARSRNDQVAFSTKLYCKTALLSVMSQVEGLADALRKLAGRNSDIVMPGFTHLQHAQPIYLKDYLLAYVEMLKRDNMRLDQKFLNTKLTMGAGALAGTPIEAANYRITPPPQLKKLSRGFAIDVTVNAVDIVSDRDFAIETLAALSILGTHLSRLAEDLIIWSTKEFGFVDIDEAYCTGSSLMPNKKNPDSLELIRGYAGRLYGNLISVITVMKGLPLSYNRDMQLDKEPIFSSFDIVKSELEVMTGLIKTLKFNKDKIETQLDDEGLYATDILYYLVKRGVAFTEAHSIVGRLVKYSLDNGIEIKSMTNTELRKFSDKLAKDDIVKLFNPLVSVKSKRSIRHG